MRQQDSAITLEGFLKHFKDKYKLELSMVSCGVSIVYSMFSSKTKERMQVSPGTRFSPPLASSYSHFARCLVHECAPLEGPSAMSPSDFRASLLGTRGVSLPAKSRAQVEASEKEGPFPT